MAAPNLLTSTTVTGKTALANCTTVLANVITNAASSGTVVKLNAIVLSNYGSSTTTANAIINRAGTGSFYLGGTVSVPSNSTLILLGKDTSLYLEEGDVLQTIVSTNSTIHLTASYELIAT
jgi:hypothetical protein